MTQQKIIELIRKVKALADKGVRGEAVSAKEKLKRLCKKYNISENDLRDLEEKNDSWKFLLIRCGFRSTRTTESDTESASGFSPGVPQESGCCPAEEIRIKLRITPWGSSVAIDSDRNFYPSPHKKTETNLGFF